MKATQREMITSILDELSAIHQSLAIMIETEGEAGNIDTDDTEYLDAACGDIEGAILHLIELV